jgi:hypothetical protein
MTDEFVKLTDKQFATAGSGHRALKGYFIVKAGLFPGDEGNLPDLMRTWYYHDDDFEKDCNTPQDQITIFRKMYDAAQSYHLLMSNPQRTNFATLTFIWV